MLFLQEKCKVLIFEVCCIGSAVLLQFDFRQVGKATSVVRSFPRSKLGALEFSDRLWNLFLACLVKFFLGVLLEKI